MEVTYVENSLQRTCVETIENGGPIRNFILSFL